MKKNYILKFSLLSCLFLFIAGSWAQVTTFTYTGAADSYIVPAGVSNIEISVSGASGGDGAGGTGGLGATMVGTFSVSGGDVLEVVVGEAGLQYGNSGGGGGGSGVSFGGAPMIVAGGGGGGGTNASGYGGVITEEGGSSSGAGGTAGNGGEKGYRSGDCGWASGGGGYFGDGYGGNGVWDGGTLPGTLAGTGAGSSWVSGGAGGSNGGCSFTYPNEGAFGCGGGGAGSYGGAGGGGYSGGGGGQYVDPDLANRGGGGGGSFNDGIDQVNTPADNAGNGVITITVLCEGLVPTIPVTGVCIGETLVLDVASGTGGTITWDGGVTNGVAFAPPLGTTIYTATSSSIEDCNFEIEITASEIPTITANSSVLTACEGADVVLWGEGGDTYTWTGTGAIDPADSVAFEAEDGIVTYTVVGSILGCEGDPAEIVLEGAPQPDAVATATPASVCLGESFVLTGSGAFSYEWGGTISDGDEITPGSAGTLVYNMVGTSDVGCGDTTSVTVIVNAVPVVNAGLNVAQCVGMDVTLNASGAASYEWDGGVTDGTPFTVTEGETTYTVTGTGMNGCSDEDEIVVTGVGYPVITAVVNDEFSPFGASIDLTVTGGSGPYGYSWSHGPTTEDVSGLTGGTYTVDVSDSGVEAGICPDVDSTFTIQSFVGISELTSTNLNIYPNPALENITVAFEGEFTYEITSLNGQVLISGTATDQEMINLDNVAAGAYIITVIAGGESHTARIVKQ